MKFHLPSPWWKVKPADVENGLLLIKPNVKDALVREMAVLEKDTNIEDLGEAARAYFRVLNHTLEQIPQDHLAPLKIQSPSNKEALPHLYDIMLEIAAAFRSEPKHVYLDKLCLGMKNKGLMIGDVNDIAQLVFILIGCLTMIYTPLLNPEPGKLQMRVTALTASQQRRRRSTWHTGSQDVGGVIPGVSFDDLLFRYCRSSPIPRPRIRSSEAIDSATSRLLKSQNVSYYSLAKLLKVEISWTMSIFEHLEFNLKTRTLKLFRVPSYCVMLVTIEPDNTFLDSLFQKFIDEEDEHSADEASPIIAADFFREIIASYRLIFGQHADSRRLIKEHCMKGRLAGYKIPYRPEHPSALVRGQSEDPLLEKLCFKDSRDEGLFVDLDMMELKAIYVLDTDFPYFADRLAALQEFVENQCPSGFMALWRDRRDVAKFWTIWAVVLFGVPSLILAVIQTVLTGFQLRPNND